jgi:chondroitin 4-sulfotransferase 11
MNISSEYKCIFVHIPKVAGTSVKQVLGMPGSGHFPWQFYANNFSDEWHSYLIFSVVRNPWDRTVSAYTYARMEKSFWHDSRTAPHPDYEVLKNATFAECCEILVNRRELLKHESWFPQYSWIAGKRNEEIVLVVPNILRCETLDHDFAGLCAKLGTPPIGLPRINASGHGNYRDYYDDTTREQVAQVYAEDIRLFDYGF